MRRALACILVIMLLFSISGCTPKSEYQKLQEEKVAIEKQNTSLTLAKARVEEKVAAQQKEISGLKTALKGKEGELRTVKKELEQAKAQLKNLQK